MARAIEGLLADNCLRDRMGNNAARDARKRFDLQRQVDDYLGWYEQLLESASARYQDAVNCLKIPRAATGRGLAQLFRR